MYISEISIKNFLSYGEVPTVFKMDRHNITLVAAKNGEGKSTIIDAMTFVFFGKAFRNINKDLLINSTNKKNTVVECKLIGNNGKNVLIRRGLKPAIFEIYEDDVLVNQNAASRDYQAYLESNIIGMNFIIFSQTVIISKTRYVPFMRLKTGERRAFVESILNLKILGTMQKLQSKIVSGLKTDLSELKTNIKVEDNNESNKLESIRKLISLKKGASDDAQEQNKKNIEDISVKIETLTESAQECTSRIDLTDYTKKAEFYDQLVSINNNYRSKCDAILADIKKTRDAKDTCYACGSPIDISHVEVHVKQLKEDLKNYKNKIDMTKEQIEKLKPIYDLYTQQSSNNKILKAEIASYKRQIEDLLEDKDIFVNKKFDSSKYDAEIDIAKSELQHIKKNLKSYNASLQKLLIDIDNNELAMTLLKDTGIKSSIIQNSISSINNIIAGYLLKFGFFISFTFDSEFNETIRYKGTNHLTYESYSEGEKLRIDLSLILAWREIALLKNGTSCNILFFDEIADASMDNDGVEHFAKALNSLKNTNVWIITHTPAKLENYARGYIQLDKVDGFTIIKK